LGFMFLALGCGLRAEDLPRFAVTAAIFHLFTHAFFKALLFLAAGSVMHAMGDLIDMRRFGGLRKVLPITHVTFLCGAAALAGFPGVAAEPPGGNFFSRYLSLSPLFRTAGEPEHHFDWLLAGGSALVALAGIGAAWLVYGREPGLADRVRRAVGGLYDWS